MAMVRLIVLSALLAVQASVAYEVAVPVFKQPYGDGDSTYIIDGELAEKGQFPHQAGITIDDSHFCGGALISKSWILTAGHCVSGFGKWSVVLGALKIKEPNEAGRIVIVSNKGILHDGYDSKTISNDIGVISLPKEVKLSDQINIIPLPPPSFRDESFVGKLARVSGWGKTSDSASSISPTLKFVDLQIVELRICKDVFGGTIPSSIFCCKGEGQKSVCNGDSGGALTIGTGKNRTHLGIVSFGSSRGCSQAYPMGFTSTPIYVEWVSSQTGIPIPDFETI